jgi:hypothetical protein
VSCIFRVGSIASSEAPNPDAAAHKLMELANAFEPVQDGRIYIRGGRGTLRLAVWGTNAGRKALRLYLRYGCIRA